jgi:ElaB/YqjD/DUF883 family membrane-anchored ribosome-binding protein
MAEYEEKKKETVSPEASESSLGETAESVKGAAKEAGAKAEQSTRDLREQAQETAKSAAAQQTSRAGHRLIVAAEAFRETGRNLREKDMLAMANLAERTAEQMEGISGYLLENDIDDLIDDAEEFVRRRPVLSISGAFFAGAVLARFLKASGKKAA